MTATLVLTNANIITMDARRPVARAIALRGDRILALGDDAEMKALLRPGGEWVDLGGAAVTPGLVDAHVHFAGYAQNLRRIDLFLVPTLAEAQRRVAAAVAARPAGAWLTGRGWQQDIWPGRQLPAAADLDGVSGAYAVALNHKSGHASWVNSRALQLAGIDDDTPDPAGGEIQRDENGRATGILFEEAMKRVGRLTPKATPADLAEMMVAAQARAWRGGLVGVHDFDGSDCFSALQLLHNRAELGLRIVKNIPAPHLAEAIGVGLRSGFGNDWLRIGGIKIFADGALGPRTALMIEPYTGERDNRGIAVTDKEEMMAIASQASAHGLSVTVHAIGDRANHDILDVYEAVRAEEAARGQGRTLRHRIEHVQILHPADSGRLAALDVIASMQPTHATADMEMADSYWGDRAQLSYAWRTLLNSGAVLAFGSDAPIEAIEPLPGLYAAVTRNRPDGAGGPDGWYPQEKLTLHEAVHAFTLGAAYAAGTEADTGSLAPGKLADLTLLDRDIFAAPAAALLETTVAGTIVGGEFRYRNV